MLDKSFCIFLEYKIGEALTHLNLDETRGFWCDGVILTEPEQNYTSKFVNDHRQVILKAFIGKDGQTEYELKLYFGPKALSRYARGLDMIPCVPEPDEPGWLIMDTNKHTIEIQLL